MSSSLDKLKEEKYNFDIVPKPKKDIILTGGKENKIEYDFDMYGNWITKRVFSINTKKEFILKTVVSRVIKYYNNLRLIGMVIHLAPPPPLASSEP